MKLEWTWTWPTLEWNALLSKSSILLCQKSLLNPIWRWLKGTPHSSWFWLRWKIQQVTGIEADCCDSTTLSFVCPVKSIHGTQLSFYQRVQVPAQCAEDTCGQSWDSVTEVGFLVWFMSVHQEARCSHSIQQHRSRQQANHLRNLQNVFIINEWDQWVDELVPLIEVAPLPFSPPFGFIWTEVAQ